MLVVKKNEAATAQRTIEFALISSGDGETLMTGQSPSVLVSGNGNSAAGDNSVTEVTGADGFYSYVLSQAETNVDFGSIAVTCAGCITFFMSFVTKTKTIDMLQDLSAADAADAVWDELLVNHLAAGSFGLFVGNLSPISGASTVQYTVYESDGTTPVQGVLCEMFINADGTGIISRAYTDSLGIATFRHDQEATTVVYIFRYKPTHAFDDPDTEVIA